MKKLRFNKKSAALILATVMVVGTVGGNTLAWLKSETTAVTNNFTKSNITVHLNEDQTSREFKMVPGWTINKTPYAYVGASDEDCYLFIQITENGITADGTTYDFDQFIDYKVKDEWIELGSTYPGVYYKVIDTTGEKGDTNKHYILGAGTFTNDTVDTSDDILWGDGQVLAKPDVTVEMMQRITTTNRPTLSFKAYAVQLWKTNKPADGASQEQIEAAQFTPTAAWELANQ